MFRPWVVYHIGYFAEPALEVGGFAEYRRLLKLYSELDRDLEPEWELDRELAPELARRTSHHPYAEIRKLGRDYLAEHRP